jgi:hypothetical protein
VGNRNELLASSADQGVGDLNGGNSRAQV